MSNKDNSRTYKTFNLQKYYVEIKLHNPDGDEMTLNPESMLQLVIEDDMHFWPVRGFFVYENPYEIIERKMTQDNEIETSDLDAKSRISLKNLKPYLFRNDGRDFIDITIRPELDENSDIPIKQLDPKVWELNYKCVIYDKEDIEVSDVTKKIKKFYFWDADYQKMIENIVQWSTSTSEYNDTKRLKGASYNPSQATDEERQMYTGSAIQSLLLENGFKVKTDPDLFDRGSTKIFHSCYQDKNIWQNIEYILNNHMSTKTQGTEPLDESDLCIFDKDPTTNEFELMPINKVFKKAGNDVNLPKEFQIEHLFFDETGTPSNSPYKAPFLAKNSTTSDTKMTKIKKYQFVDMAAADNTHMLVTMPVHTYDYRNKTFSISMENSNVKVLEEKVKNLYIHDRLLTKNGLHPLLTLNKDKIANKTISPKFSIRPNKASVSKMGIGLLLYTSLFFNECLAFQVDGATIRRTSRFVGIDRQTSSDNALDYKLCGQWFITKVTHNFFHNMYTNDVIAVKLHSYDNLNISNEV